MSSKQILSFTVLVALAALVPACAGNSAAECDPACNPENFETCCDGTCVTFRDDEQNCGGCGLACSPGQYCEFNECVGTPTFDAGPIPPGVDGGPPSMMCGSIECPAGQRCCGTRCLERSTPTGDYRTHPAFENCNGCGLACDAEKASSCSVPGGGDGAPRCMCGEFNACDASSVCVNDASVGWTCTNLQIDRNNCGTLGNVCAEGESCSSGMCVCGSTGGRCTGGQACCGGSCIDVSADAANCGACGNACGVNAPNCQAGSCVCGTGSTARACTATTMGALGESCCDDTCVANDDSNCGCGVMCDTAGDEMCIVDSGLFGMGGSGGVCCGTEALPGFGFCSGGGTLDGGLPFP